MQIQFLNFYNIIELLFVEMIKFIITAPDSLSLFGKR